MDKNLQDRARAIPLQKKRAMLKELDEDRFRDSVVRPLFLFMGFEGGHDLHGPEEYGKDVYFHQTNPFGTTEITVVQTKAGPITMSSTSPGPGIVTIKKQLMLALETNVNLLERRIKSQPSRVMLCTSGTISEGARRHILDELKDGRIQFLDADAIIELMNDFYPEYFLNLNVETNRYVANLRDELSGETFIPPGGSDAAPEALVNAATDDRYVDIALYRTRQVPVTVRGQTSLQDKIDNFSVTDILGREDRRIIIFGDAGSGKSTCVRHAALELLNAARGQQSDDIALPIILPAKALSASAAGILDACVAQYSRVVGRGNVSLPTTAFSRGKIVIIIDGLDEIGDLPRRGSVMNSLSDFHTRYPACKIIITSRELTSIRELPTLDSYLVFRISKINVQQAQRMASKLLTRRNAAGNVMTQEQIDDLSERVFKRITQLHGMELSPLLVAVFVHTSDDGYEDVPPNITELFKKYSDLLLGRWSRSKGLSQQYHAGLKSAILSKIAFEIHQSRRTTIPLDVFEEQVRKFLIDKAITANANVIYREIIESGLFRTVSNSVSFGHHMLQEFFAGLGMPGDEYVARVIGDDWWRNPVVFYFGDKAGAESDLERIATVVEALPAEEKMSGAIALGLALQAAYLTGKTVKKSVFVSVTKCLASAFSTFETTFDAERRYPLLSMAAYYYLGRDSVALSAVREFAQEIWDEVTGDSTSVRDLRAFWFLVALVETTNFDQAIQYLKKYTPSDRSPLLAMDFACFLAAQMKSISKDKRRDADRLHDSLEEKTRGLGRQLAKEVQKRVTAMRSLTEGPPLKKLQ